MTDEMDTQTSDTFLAFEKFNKLSIMYTNMTEDVKGIIISNEMNWYLNVYLYILVSGNVSIIGTLANICNLVVFYALGIKDSMSVCLFSLSIADFSVSFLTLVGKVFMIWNIFYDNEGVDPMGVRFASTAWFVDICFLCSGWIVTFLSLERCVCVTFPFKVKYIFTRNRSIVAIVIIYLVNITTHVPIYMTQSLGWVTEDIQVDNTTHTISRMIVKFTEDRQQVKTVVNVFSSTVIPMPALGLTLASVFWMIYGLKASAKFHQAMPAISKQETGKEKKGFDTSMKTRKLVKVVLALAIIFFMCSIPRIIGKFAYIIYPAMSEGGRDRNLNTLVWQCARLFCCINASVNIYVYLRINTSYRAKFKELFLP